ncbi:MAG: bacillithiol biosynthesis deacetylase BshB1 [Candidatus Humimicrobiaceae bacterium]
MIKTDVLAFGPHPDDVEMGCGGLLIKLKKIGYKTGIIDLTRGELSSNGDIETRMGETRAASEVLGLDVRENLNLQDGNIINDIESRNRIIEMLRKYQPKMVLLPYYKDRHPDHENAHKLIKDSVFISGLIRYQTSMDFFRPDIVLNYMLHFEFTPSFIVDIADELEKKVEAVTAYKSQFFSTVEKDVVTHISTKSFKDILHTRAKYFGLKINSSAGEAYFINSKIKINDPLDFFNYVKY